MALLYTTVSVYVFGIIFYTIFGSGELQPWAVPPSSSELGDSNISDTASSVKDAEEPATDSPMLRENDDHQDHGVEDDDSPVWKRR